MTIIRQQDTLNHEDVLQESQSSQQRDEQDSISCSSTSPQISKIQQKDHVDFSLKTVPSRLEFRHWGYLHASRKTFAVQDLNLVVEPSQRVLLLGASGIGKSTILQGASGIIGSPDTFSAKTASTDLLTTTIDADGGRAQGIVLVDDVSVRVAKNKVGLVLQDPESQVIFNRMGDNVAFGPENLHVEREEIWQRVREALRSVGMEGIDLQHSTFHLSGGQTQRLAIAGALAMQPSVLLMDEPTANLDPAGIAQVVETVLQVVENYKPTMMLVEHHAQPWIPLIDRVVVLDKHRRNASYDSAENKDIQDSTFVLADGTIDEIFRSKQLDFDDLGIWIPEQYRHKSPQIYLSSKNHEEKNLNVPIANVAGFSDKQPVNEQSKEQCDVHGSDVTFVQSNKSNNNDRKLLLKTDDLAIGRNNKPIAEHMNLSFYSGEVVALVGANGTGKSTLSLTLAGLLKPISGSVKATSLLQNGVEGNNPIEWKSVELSSRIAYVFQNPEHQFVRGSVIDEVMVSMLNSGMNEQKARKKAMKLLEEFKLQQYANVNPYTLSGGEKRRLTVASALAAAPQVVILDEPTFGQDKQTFTSMVQLIGVLKSKGICVIVVTHDKQLIEDLQARVIELVADNAQPLWSSGERVSVSVVNDRNEDHKPSSHSKLVASMNPIMRFFAGLVISLPLFFTLDVVSSGITLVIEIILLTAIGFTPKVVVKTAWPVLIGGVSAVIGVLLYGKTGGQIYFTWGWIVVSHRSITLAIATGLRVLAIGLPAILLVFGIDATDLADATSQHLKISDRAVYGGLAGLRLFNILQDDWNAVCLSRRSRGLSDGNKIAALFPQAFALLVLSIRRSTMLATAMEARGFGGTEPRSHARVSKIHTRDWVVTGICFIVPFIGVCTAWYVGAFTFFGGM